MNDLFLKVIKRYRFNPVVKAGLLLTGSVPKPEKWVFIIGCYNSGTTLLESLLAKHPEVGSLKDEGVILTGYLNRPEDFGWTRMWHKCFDQVKMDETDGSDRALKIKKHWSHVYPDKKVLIEKSIVNTARIPFFKAHFSPAYFIYIVRNGYAVAEGIRRKANPKKYGNGQFVQYPVELCARQWQVTHDTVMQQRSGITNFLQISYEDLSMNPRETIRKCTDFLQLDPLNETLLSEEQRIHRQTSSIRNMNENSLLRLSASDMDTIEREAGEALAFYHYTRPGHEHSRSF